MLAYSGSIYKARSPSRALFSQTTAGATYLIEGSFAIHRRQIAECRPIEGHKRLNSLSNQRFVVSDSGFPIAIFERPHRGRDLP
jgi:hypothetical protein